MCFWVSRGASSGNSCLGSKVSWTKGSLEPGKRGGHLGEVTLPRISQLPASSSQPLQLCPAQRHCPLLATGRKCTQRSLSGPQTCQGRGGPREGAGGRTRGAAGGQPALTVGVQGQQAGGAEQFHTQLLLRGAVGSLDRDGPQLLRGGFCLGVERGECGAEWRRGSGCPGCPGSETGRRASPAAGCGCRSTSG